MRMGAAKQGMPMREPRIDLDRVECCLRELQRAFPRINATLASRRDSLSDEVVANLLLGYGYVNRMLDERVDPFAAQEQRRRGPGRRSAGSGSGTAPRRAALP